MTSLLYNSNMVTPFLVARIVVLLFKTVSNPLVVTSDVDPDPDDYHWLFLTKPFDLARLVLGTIQDFHG